MPAERSSPGGQNLDGDINECEALLAYCPLLHPGRPHVLFRLVKMKRFRFGKSMRKEDIDDLILHLTEMLLLPLRPLNGMTIDPIIVFYDLSLALFRRSQLFQQHEDLQYSIKYFRHLTQLPLESSGIRLSNVEVLLSCALIFETRVDPAQKSGHFREVLGLYLRPRHRDDLLGGHLVGPLLLECMVESFFSASGSAQEEGIINSLRGMIEKKNPGELPEARFWLAVMLCIRCFSVREDRIEEVLDLFDESVPALEHHRPYWWHMLDARTAYGQFKLTENAESLQRATARCRQALDCCLPGDPHRSECLRYLAMLLEERFKSYGHTECLEEAEACRREALSGSLDPAQGSSAPPMEDSDCKVLLRSMAISQKKFTRVRENVPSTVHPNYPDFAQDIALFCQAKSGRTVQLADLQKMVDHFRAKLASVPRDSSVWRRYLAGRLSALVEGILTSCPTPHSLKADEDLSRGASQAPKGTGPSEFDTSQQPLGLALGLCLSLLCQAEDVETSVSHLREVVNNERDSASTRYIFACCWAYAARITRHSSASLAYQQALSLMQNSLTSGPTVQAQHTVIGRWGADVQLPLEYASYQIEEGDLERAVEVLEQGRALLWSEMRGLRTSVDRLARVDPVLAGEFQSINHALEQLTTSIPSRRRSKPLRKPTHDRESDQFSRTFNSHRELLEQRKAVVSRIRALPGFEHFLQRVPFSTLRAAASRGPVIIVNHSKHGQCGILIVLHDSAPIHIPTAEDFYERGVALSEDLFGTRERYPLESRQYQRALRTVLAALHDLVGQPVIDKLRELGIPEESRVWWCPTSVFCSLPLHAMGPLDPVEKPRRYFSDVYISSYTPTLSALIESRETGTRMSRSPSLLAVGQPDASLPGVKGEIEVIRKLGRSTGSPHPRPFRMSRHPRNGQAVRSLVSAPRRRPPHTTRHRPFATPLCRIRVPLCLSHRRAF
ncbi:hypothetical protein BC834DRAFT_182837 [Gloeopeniophorella convolvens]|nr:hypothetical protein BC834DRAFT_182837 [Gloeopeniophorella convolvens]